MISRVHFSRGVDTYEARKVLNGCLLGTDFKRTIMNYLDFLDEKSEDSSEHSYSSDDEESADFVDSHLQGQNKMPCKVSGLQIYAVPSNPSELAQSASRTNIDVPRLTYYEFMKVMRSLPKE